MAGQGVIQAELSIELGKYLAALNQAQAAIAKYAAAAGGSMQAANQAYVQSTDKAAASTKSLGDTIRTYKAEQSQQARTASFFVRELTDMTGMSKDASAAVGGLGQVMLEAAAGGSAFAVGFEAVKFVVSQVVAEWRRAGEELAVLERAQQGVTNALMAGKDAFEKYATAAKVGGDKAYAEVFDAATQSVKELSKELNELRAKGPGWLAYVRLAFKDTDMIDAFEAKVRAVSDSIGQAVANAKRMAEEAKNLHGPGTAAGETTFRSEYSSAQTQVANDAAELIKTRQKLIADSFDRLIADVAAKNAKLLEALSKPVANESYDKAKEFRDVRAPATQMLAEWKMKQPVIDTDFFSKGQEKALEPLKKMQDEMKKTAEVGAAVGDAFGSVFASIGSSIGGTAGEFIAQVGAMIAQTIALVLALAFSDTLMQGPLGVYAAIPMAAAILASLVGMIASVPSFDVGTLSVPKTGLAMVHAGEAILPVGGPAETYRAGLARSGARAGGATTVNVSMNISGAIDGPSVYRTLNGSRDQLARVIREAVRDGVMG